MHWADRGTRVSPVDSQSSICKMSWVLPIPRSLSGVVYTRQVQPLVVFRIRDLFRPLARSLTSMGRRSRPSSRSTGLLCITISTKLGIVQQVTMQLTGESHIRREKLCAIAQGMSTPCEHRADMCTVKSTETECLR